MFLTPHELNFEVLMKNSRKKNEKECVKAVLYIVILEYSLYSKLSCCIHFIQFARIKNLIWDQLQVTKAEIIQS